MFLRRVEENLKKSKDRLDELKKQPAALKKEIEDLKRQKVNEMSKASTDNYKLTNLSEKISKKKSDLEDIPKAIQVAEEKVAEFKKQKEKGQKIIDDFNKNEASKLPSLTKRLAYYIGKANEINEQILKIHAKKDDDIQRKVGMRIPVPKKSTRGFLEVREINEIIQKEAKGIEFNRSGYDNRKRFK